MEIGRGCWRNSVHFWGCGSFSVRDVAFYAVTQPQLTVSPVPYEERKVCFVWARDKRAPLTQVHLAGY